MQEAAAWTGRLPEDVTRETNPDQVSLGGGGRRGQAAAAGALGLDPIDTTFGPFEIWVAHCYSSTAGWEELGGRIFREPSRTAPNRAKVERLTWPFGEPRGRVTRSDPESCGSIVTFIAPSLDPKLETLLLATQPVYG